MRRLLLLPVGLLLAWLSLIPIGAIAGYTNPPPSSFVASLAMIGSSTSAQLAALLSDETGTDKAVFSQGPTFGGAVGMTGTLSVTGAAAITGALGVTGALTVQGAANLTGPVAVSGASGSTGLTITQKTNGQAVAIVGAPAGTGLSVDGKVGISGPITTTTTAATTGLKVTGVDAQVAAIFQAAGTTGVALNAIGNVNNGSYALQIFGDATSPTKGSVAMQPQDANPSGTAVVGDLFMFTNGFLRVATATTPVWNDISGFGTVVTGVTAFSTGGQASATLVCASGNNTIVSTVAAGGDSVKFPPTPVVDQYCTVKNKGANSMNLFPGSGDVICVSGGACGAADAATAVAANAQVDCWAESVSTWNCR